MSVHNRQELHAPTVVPPGARQIELNLREMDQLFNTMDPSPFHEKDLDHDAEEFIVSWAEEFHSAEPVQMIVHLQTTPKHANAQTILEGAIHHYFSYRTAITRLEFRRLMKQGRVSLVVGLGFLLACFVTAEWLVSQGSSIGSWRSFFKEGLTIAGWVAMWKPLEIYLYEWWPMKRRARTYEKLSTMPVLVRVQAG